MDIFTTKGVAIDHEPDLDWEVQQTEGLRLLTRDAAQRGKRCLFAVTEFHDGWEHCASAAVSEKTKRQTYDQCAHLESVDRRTLIEKMTR